MTFEEFTATELPALARYARVLTGDRQRAHDVLADALVDARLKWQRIGALEFPAAYVRRMVTTTYLADRRRWSSRHIQPVADLPERESGDDATGAVDDRSALQPLLAALPRQQRAAVVLRYYLDLPDDAIARELRCSTGAVRSYISRGLAALRIAAVEDGLPSPARAKTDQTSARRRTMPVVDAKPSQQQPISIDQPAREWS